MQPLRFFSHAIFLRLPFFVVLCACAQQGNDNFLPTSEVFDRLSPQMQADLAPTALFRSIYRNDKVEFQKELAQSYVDLVKKNKDGNTAIAIAILLLREDFVLALIDKSSFLDLTVPNKNNRSAVSLLAEYDMEDAFDNVAEKFFQQLGVAGKIKNNFNEIDYPDDESRRAAFYVQSASFLDKLQNLWFYGVLSFQHPWDNFFNHRDLQGNTFLHLAATFDKTEILKWYIDRFCTPPLVDGEEGWWLFETVRFGASKVRDFMQDSDFIPIRRRFINLQNFEGNSPLHLAAQKGNFRSVELLFQCQSTDPTQENQLGQIPLQFMLAHLDKDQVLIAENYKFVALLFVDKVNPLWGFIPMNNFKSLVNHLDHDGHSAIHMAARLRDPFFYKLFEPFMMPDVDEDGVTARDRKR